MMGNSIGEVQDKSSNGEVSALILMWSIIKEVQIFCYIKEELLLFKKFIGILFRKLDNLYTFKEGFQVQMGKVHFKTMFHRG